MTCLKDLTKDELLSFITNHFHDINQFDKLAGCVNDPESKDALYVYICDECQEE
jgi:hypothetical protein